MDTNETEGIFKRLSKAYSLHTRPLDLMVANNRDVPLNKQAQEVLDRLIEDRKSNTGLDGCYCYFSKDGQMYKLQILVVKPGDNI